MNTTFIKICGLRTREDVHEAVAAGADALGFVFAESPRRISVADAAALAADLPPAVLRVAVMREPTAKLWAEVAQGFRPDCLQMEAANFPVLGACLNASIGVDALPVYRDRPGLDEQAVANEATVLFEGARSGTGQVADWDRAARLARSTRLVLAGGLNADNVASAIASVRPWGVDVSSGVERSRGVKDPRKIRAFIDAVRNLEPVHAD